MYLVRSFGYLGGLEIFRDTRHSYRQKVEDNRIEIATSNEQRGDYIVPRKVYDLLLLSFRNHCDESCRLD